MLILGTKANAAWAFAKLNLKDSRCANSFPRDMASDRSSGAPPSRIQCLVLSAKEPAMKGYDRIERLHV